MKWWRQYFERFEAWRAWITPAGQLELCCCVGSTCWLVHRLVFVIWPLKAAGQRIPLVLFAMVTMGLAGTLLFLKLGLIKRRRYGHQATRRCIDCGYDLSHYYGDCPGCGRAGRSTAMPSSSPTRPDTGSEEMLSAMSLAFCTCFAMYQIVERACISPNRQPLTLTRLTLLVVLVGWGLFIVQLARTGLGKRQRWRRQQAGQCVECGCDLRQSAGRCPECGAEPS